MKSNNIEQQSSDKKFKQCDKTSVLVCGLLTTDIVFAVNNIPSDAVKYRAENVDMHCGGGGCYAAVAITRLGGCCSLLAKVGGDEFGKIVLNALETENIDHTNVVVDQQAHTPISSIAIDQSGERQILNYRDQTPTAYTESLILRSPPRAVLVDARWIEGSVSALNYAKLHSIPAVVDAESPVSEEAMTLATHIAFSRQGLSEFAATDSVLDGLRKVATRFSAWACVTDGENGTHIWNNGQLDSIPTPTVDAIDTLGAGDVWHGAFTLQLAQGIDERGAVKFANAAAALKCTRAGGGWSAPTLSEVNEYYAAL